MNDYIDQVEPIVTLSEFQEKPDITLQVKEARWFIDEIRRLRNVIVHKNLEIKRLRFWASETISLHNSLYTDPDPDSAILFDDWMDRGPDGITLPNKH